MKESYKILCVLFIALFVFPLSVFSQQGTGPKVLFIGDSLTDGGWGCSGGRATPSNERNHWDWNHIYGHSYMYLCAAHYMGHEPEKELQFFNRGIGGDALQDLINRWQNDCIAIQPQVVSILVGVNDVTYWLREGKGNFDFKDWESRYRSLIEHTQACLPDVHLVLCTPFVVKSGEAAKSENFDKRAEAVRKLAETVRKIATDYHLTCVCFDELFAELPTIHPTIPLIHWSWDGTHPTPAGHQLMADLWIKTVKL